MGSGRNRGKDERLAVPAMPMPLAVVCCVLNFLVPGLGTVIAGLSSFCCARNEDMDSSSRCGSCCIGFGIGFLQLLTTVTCLIGWVWSCVWGIFMIGMSAEYYHNNPPDGQGRGHMGTVIAPAPTIVSQPAPSGYPPPVAFGPPPPPYNISEQHPLPQQYNTVGHYPAPPNSPPPPYSYPSAPEPTLPSTVHPIP
ncbi:protein SPEC3-like [Haliotis asinina]|uniref:protein SPEC3-like n=1 Tax=Haliotis asinina TaxID=109174 RepID=UPI0035323D70